MVPVLGVLLQDTSLYCYKTGDAVTFACLEEGKEVIGERNLFSDLLPSWGLLEEGDQHEENASVWQRTLLGLGCLGRPRTQSGETSIVWHNEEAEFKGRTPKMESEHVGGTSSDVQEAADCQGRTAGKFLVMET